MKSSVTLSLFVLTGIAAAQQPDVLPRGGAQFVTRHYEELLLPRSVDCPVRIQHIYDAAQFARARGTLQSLAFRRNNHYQSPLPGGRITLTVRIGYSDQPANKASKTFDLNMVKAVPFFQGTLDVPGMRAGSGPAPFSYVIKPRQPIVFEPRGTGVASVCIESVITASTYTLEYRRLDALQTEHAARRNNGASASSCRFSNDDYNGAIAYTLAGLTPNGGSWHVTYRRVPSGTPGVAAISLHGVDRPGVWPLPLSLAPFGAPGCAWNVGLETGIWIGFVANAANDARIDATIPKSPGGWSFFDQGLFFDSRANAAGLVVSWSSEWYVSLSNIETGATVYRTRDFASDPVAESRTQSQVVFCEFVY